MAGIEEIQKFAEIRRQKAEMKRIKNHNLAPNHILMRTLTIKQLGDLLGDDKPISEDTIRSWYRDDYKLKHGFKLEHYKIGTKVIFLDTQVIDFIENCSGRKLTDSK